MSMREMKAETQGRKRSKERGEMLVTGLLSMAGSPWILYNPGPLVQVWYDPQCVGHFPSIIINCWSSKCLYKLTSLQDKLKEVIPHLRSLFLCASNVSQVDKNKQTWFEKTIMNLICLRLNKKLLVAMQRCYFIKSTSLTTFVAQLLFLFL